VINDTHNIVIADIARLVGGRRKVVGSWKWKEKEAQAVSAMDMVHVYNDVLHRGIWEEIGNRNRLDNLAGRNLQWKSKSNRG
jgi:hypothetical protein